MSVLADRTVVEHNKVVEFDFHDSTYSSCQEFLLFEQHWDRVELYGSAWIFMSQRFLFLLSTLLFSHYNLPKINRKEER